MSATTATSARSALTTTQTSHEPGPDELARAEADGHAADDNGDGHRDGHGDGHGEEALGPVDVQAWGALLIGRAAGLGIAFFLLVTTTLLR